MTNGKLLRIEVSPNINHQPQVKLSERSPKGESIIRWEKAAGAEDFDFIGFAPVTAPLENPFQKIVINKNSIQCDFAPSNHDHKGVEYDYILVIEYKGIPYNTTKTVGASFSDGRAVIRN